MPQDSGSHSLSTGTLLIRYTYVDSSLNHKMPQNLVLWRIVVCRDYPYYKKVSTKPLQETVVIYSKSSTELASA